MTGKARLRGELQREAGVRSCSHNKRLVELALVLLGRFIGFKSTTSGLHGDSLSL